ncbi:MAG: peptidoglycan-binding protein [Actinomycetia bacterium]|nr:peptidoglycan-binding protein [Actinomycetes bacterium]
MRRAWRRRAAAFLAALLAAAGGSAFPGLAPAHAQVLVSAGYWLVGADGSIYPFGNAKGFGSMAGKPLNQPVVGMAVTPDQQGYWEVASDGGIFTFGDAGFYGSMGGHPLNQPVVGMAATPDGKGYWEVARDGGIFTFGDATFYGSLGANPPPFPVVGMAATPDGRGYWLAAANGAVWAFGDAQNYGSMAGHPLNAPVVGIVATPDGRGYWLVARDGGVFTFGDAGFYGSMGGRPMNAPVVGLIRTADGQGYWLVGRDGGIFSFGDAHFFGSVPGLPKPAPAPVVGGVGLVGDTPVLSLGWGFFTTYPGTQPGAWWDLQHYWNELSVIVPDWYWPSVSTNAGAPPSGSGTAPSGPAVVVDGPSPSLVQQVETYAHAQGVAVWPSVGWPGPSGTHGVDVVATPALAQSLVQQITQIAVQNGFDGMTLDFEGMPTADWQAFDQFVAALAQSLHAVGKKLMVATYPSGYPDSAYDFAGLAQAADYINLMTYSEHTNQGSYAKYEGPNAGMPWVNRYVQQAIAAGVPAGKIILGLGPYGHGWTYTPSGYVPPATTDYITDYAASTMTKSGVVWDPWQEEEVFTAGPLAQAPQGPLQYAPTQFSTQVQALQSLLNYILVRYAVQDNQSAEPPNLVVDGYFGPATQAALELFQKDAGLPVTGVYDAATQQELANLIQTWQIGQTVYWVEDSQALGLRMQYAVQQGLAGIAPWRLGFESAGYWSDISQYLNVAKVR